MTDDCLLTVITEEAHVQTNGIQTFNRCLLSVN